MSTEIATWNMIRSKILSFPPPSTGRGNECLTKTEIQSLGGESLSINGNYGNSECVILDHIEKVTWEYTFSVQPASLNFAAVRSTQSVLVTSYKEKKINDIPTGIQENVGFSSSPSEGWLSSGGTSVTVSENTITSRRTGNVMYTQHERGTTIPVSVGQDPAVITYRYEISSSQYYFEKARNTSGWNTTYGNVISEKQTLRNGNIIDRQKVDWGLATSSSASSSDRCAVYCKSYSNKDVAIIQVNQLNASRFSIADTHMLDNNLQGSGQMWIKQNVTGGAIAVITFDVNT